MNICYPSAKALIRHPRDPFRYLMIQRFIGDLTFFEPAGGKVAVDYKNRTIETFEECIVREVEEELGVKISLEEYIGSYTFFWRIDPNKSSCCVLFSALLNGKQPDFSSNTDTDELPFKPIWVGAEEIVEGKIQFDPLHTHLEELLRNYIGKLLNS